MPNYEIAKSIVEKFTKAGYIAYFAGGWVRDYLLGLPSDDIDIVTNANPVAIQTLFEKTIPVGINFGIVVVVVENHQFEVASFRKEKDYVDGRRPSFVESASPQEDAMRRDFTINGLFFNPLTEEIFDYVNGRSDLKDGVIRAIGNPHERFLEDRLRMIRAVRYAARFHFIIESATKKALLAHAQELFPSVAIERVYNEFEKMAKYPGFEKALITLHELKLLAVIFPNIENVERNVRFIPDFPDNAPTIAKLLELFPNTSLEEKLEICDLFKLSNADRNFVIYYHQAMRAFELPFEELERYEWAKLYAHPHFEIALACASTRCLETHRERFIQSHQNHFQRLESHILRLKQNTPLVRAHHLIERGIERGPQMGKLLEEAQRLSINEGIEDIATLLNLLK